MPSLLEWQRAFAANLPRPYRINVESTREKALAGAYPVVRKIVGEEFFRAMAREYARAFPSRSGDLNQYGEHLAGFVAGYAHTQDLPYLPDVARLDWLAHRAHFAADTPQFDARGLDASSRLLLAPACALLASHWPLARLWEVHQDGYTGEFSVDLAAGPQRVLVHRRDWRVQVTALGHGDYGFLAACAGGATLGDALEQAAASDADFAAADCLARWVVERVLTR